jgi:hypothetical protein
MAKYVGNGLLMRAARLAVAALALGTVVAWCQSSNGSVRGEVHDQTTAVIPGVSVVLTNTDTNVDMKTANSVGLYVFPSVIPGPYKVVVEFAGMKRFEGTLTVRTQESEVVDVMMLPAGTATAMYPSNYLSLNSTLDPNYGLYGTNTVNVPLSTGVQQPIAYGALNSYINQFVSSTNIWSFDASLGKNFHLNERFRLRLQMDAFNAVNVPGNSYSPGTYGIAYTNTNVNTPRQLQLAGHLYW